MLLTFKHKSLRGNRFYLTGETVQGGDEPVGDGGDESVLQGAGNRIAWHPSIKEMTSENLCGRVA